jgi:hypothetical protein
VYIFLLALNLNLNTKETGAALGEVKLMLPMAQPIDQQAFAIASGLQTGTVSVPLLGTFEVKKTTLVNILPAGWRQPYPNESLRGGALFGILTLVCFLCLNYPEIRMNIDFLPAMCEPYNSGVLHPEIRPYRHCFENCYSSCFPSTMPVSCLSKMGRHWSINEYDMDAMWYIAGSCAGSSCCAQTVCQRCTRTTTRCSRRLHDLFDGVELVHYNTSMAAIETDEADADFDRHEVFEDESPLSEAHVPEETFPWAAPLGRRLQADNCRQVTSTYDCNCRCTSSVYARACTVNCVPYWRSFVPIRVTVGAPAPGFGQESEDRQAQYEFSAMMSVNATPAAVKEQYLAGVDRTDSDLTDAVEMAETYTLPGFASVTTPSVTQGYSRVLTVKYEHGAYRTSAIRNLQQPQFMPGMVSECFYDPRLNPNAAMISREHLKFADEMGCESLTQS